MTGKFQLWVGPLQEIPEDVEFSYYDSRRGYLFLLTDSKPKGRFKIVTPELFGELNASERAWYDDACIKLNHRWVRAHEPEAKQKVDVFLDQFEEELKREAERAGQIGRDANPQRGISGGD